jgi:hypothetical protein
VAYRPLFGRRGAPGTTWLSTSVLLRSIGGVEGLTMRYTAVLSCAVPAGAAPRVAVSLLADMMTARRWRLLRNGMSGTGLV